MPATAPHRWTRAEVMALIDSNPLQTPRYELVDGELFVTPSPNGPHQAAVGEMIVALHPYLLLTGVGRGFTSPFDVELEPGTIVQPDYFVVPPDEAKRLRTVMPARTLLLAAEVVSPSSARADRGKKRELFQRMVPEYWVIDVDAELVERWRPGDERPEIRRDRIEWHPDGSSLPFVLELADYFARVAGTRG